MGSAKTDEVKNIQLTEREIEFLNLRKLSASYREISDSLIKERKKKNLPVRGYSHESVRQGIKSALKKLNEQLFETADEYRQLQIERLEALLLANMRGGAVGKTNPDTKEFIPPEVARSKIALEIIRELSDTVGIKPAQKHEIKADVGGSIEHKLSGEVLMTIEQIYGSDSESTE